MEKYRENVQIYKQKRGKLVMLFLTFLKDNLTGKSYYN